MRPRAHACAHPFSLLFLLLPPAFPSILSPPPSLPLPPFFARNSSKRGSPPKKRKNERKREGESERETRGVDDATAGRKKNSPRSSYLYDDDYGSLFGSSYFLLACLIACLPACLFVWFRRCSSARARFRLTRGGSERKRGQSCANRGRDYYYTTRRRVRFACRVLGGRGACGGRRGARRGLAGWGAPPEGWRSCDGDL